MSAEQRPGAAMARAPDRPGNLCAGHGNDQRGMVLLVSLSLLLALALGATSAAQTTVLELRMARNSGDAALAFHAAETALVDAEDEIEGGTVGNLLTAPDYGESPVWRGYAWPDAPRAYVVEVVTTVAEGTTLAVDVYRITARGTGPGGAVAMVQGTYGVAAGPDAPEEMTGRLSWVALEWPW